MRCVTAEPAHGTLLPPITLPASSLVVVDTDNADTHTPPHLLPPRQTEKTTLSPPPPVILKTLVHPLTTSILYPLILLNVETVLAKLPPLPSCRIAHPYVSVLVPRYNVVGSET